MKLVRKKILAVVLSLAMILPALIVTVPENVYGADGITITKEGGWLEAAYAEWSPVSGATGYKAYVKKAAEADSAYVQLDNELIREYKDGHWRVDAVGLAAGSYVLKVEALSGDSILVTAETTNITVLPHDRTGFAWINGTSSGAYREDGTLKGGAKVIYVTEENKDTVKATIQTASSKTTDCIGILAILTALKKGYETSPVVIRIIGDVKDPAGIDADSNYKGDWCIDKGSKGGTTIEGIGEDATADGWGIRLKNASNVEIRNLGFINCNSDETDDIGLQQNNNHVWVHNCDFFYGHAGNDKDQVKGDGALDTKTSTYVTHSYNHFWDTGKSNLQGMKGETAENYITYHHNWYDHSDSRHPRIRTCTVHIYNNYYDGNSKYGVGVTMGASAFVENNYFRNCKYPMLISMQGSDSGSGDGGGGTFSGESGGVIKAYNNYIEGAKKFVTYQENNIEFDAYVVNSASETVPDSVKAKQGSTAYNNFDTNASLMYTYTADSPEAAKQNVMQYAGRMNGGDFKWTFNNDVDDESSALNQPLKDALVNYTTQLKAVGGIAGVTTPSTPTTPVDPEQPGGGTGGSGTGDNEGGSTGGAIISGDMAHNFTTNEKNSTFYQFSSGNLTTKGGNVTYGGVTMTQALKMDSGGKVQFTAPAKGKLTMVFASGNSGNTILVNETIIKLDSSGIVTMELPAGAVTIVRKSKESHLYYIAFEPENTGENEDGSGSGDNQEGSGGDQGDNQGGSSGETESTDQIRNFVSRFYRVILNREADEAGCKFWTDSLKNGTRDGVTVARQFFDSKELVAQNLNNEEFVRRLYLAFFDRNEPTTSTGFKFWMNYLENGISRKFVVRGFAHSAEFTTLCNNYGITRGNMVLTANMDQNANVTMYVFRCYDRVLNRQPDTNGLNFWTGEINSRRKTPVKVAEQVVFSKEFLAKKVDNETYIKILYRMFFDREADQAGFNFWMEEMNSGKRDRYNVFMWFANSPEFKAVLKTFGL